MLNPRHKDCEPADSKGQIMLILHSETGGIRLETGKAHVSNCLSMKFDYACSQSATWRGH